MADRPLVNARDDLRRYVGLPWSGGKPEVWAYRYFDILPDPDPSDVLPQDVLAAAALHPKLTQRDLVWFVDQRDRLRDFLASTPNDDLADSNPERLDVLLDFAGTGVELSLLTKVLHRKRPRLIPLLDRRLVDWYRFKLAARGAAAWPELTRALATDLAANRTALNELGELVPLTHVRVADIAIWMEGQR
ncbi:MAG TPA: DUF6308 family protein [Nocardioidaceae bacterium]|nr:DUF6308 family protein [Nocardioidaceae bacterium]